MVAVAYDNGWCRMRLGQEFSSQNNPVDCLEYEGTLREVGRYSSCRWQLRYEYVWVTVVIRT